MYKFTNFYSASRNNYWTRVAIKLGYTDGEKWIRYKGFTSVYAHNKHFVLQEIRDRIIIAHPELAPESFQYYFSDQTSVPVTIGIR